jgi:MFS family permease
MAELHGSERDRRSPAIHAVRATGSRPDPGGGTHLGSSAPAALARYVAAATLARLADAGAGIGLLLLAVDPGTGVPNGVLIGGLLTAGITAPHLLGPWLARWLDRARDGRVVLMGSFSAYGMAVAGAALLLGHAPIPLVAIAVVAAGVWGPLLTGGLSSRLAAIARDGHRARRRAEGWDAVTYGVAGTAGPAAVSVLSAATSPRIALLVLAGTAVVAALLTLTFPDTEPSAGSRGEALTVLAALRFMAGCGPLRRVTVATVFTSVAGGALSVVAVLFGETLSGRSGAGATLIAAYGLGNLTGSLLLTAQPLPGEPERLVARCAALITLGFGLCAVAPSYPLALCAFALTGAGNAPLFTATLAARSEYSPPGARAQVFVSSGGLKIAAASLGTALAGAAARDAGPRALLAAAATLTLVAAATTILDRRLTGRHGPARGRA